MGRNFGRSEEGASVTNVQVRVENKAFLLTPGS